MFERFTSEARQTVTGAQAEARRLRHAHIGTEHLLLALLAQDTPSSAVLSRHGLTHATAAKSVLDHLGASDLDAEALTSLGIDLDAVRERVEAAFGPGALDACRAQRSDPRQHIPFTPRAKKVLERALRESLALEQRHIADGHILLGLLRDGEGVAMKVLLDRGVDPVALRQEVTATLAS